MENQLATQNIFEADYVGDITATNAAYCSMIPETQEDKINLFNATNNPAHRIADHINEVIEVKDVFLETVTVAKKDEETGEEIQQMLPRTVLINNKGEGYTCTSFGIYSALKKLFSLIGEPSTWAAPVKIRIKQVSKNDRKSLTFELVK